MAAVQVFANISPEEAIFLYSRVYSCVENFTFSADKIFGKDEEDEKRAIMTRH